MKKIILFITLACIFMSVNIQDVSATTINSDLNDIVEVRIFENEERNRVLANEMLERLNRIDARILKNIKESGATLILSDAKLVDLPEFSDLRGVIPRGHTQPWDDIPGLGGFISYVSIGKSEPSIENNHGDINLELHEFGHIVDMFAMHEMDLSRTDAFIAAHAQDKNMIFPGNDYFDYVDEYFAEVFAYYYLSEEMRQYLYQYAPTTAAYLESMHYKLFTVTNITSSGFKLEWDVVEDASYYTVLLNDESYDQTEPKMQVENLIGNNTYKTQVVAKDINGNIIEESFPVDIVTLKNENIDETKINDAYNRANQVEEKDQTEMLLSLRQRAEEMFEDIDLGRVSQAEADQLAKKIEAEVDKIEKKETIEEVEAKEIETTKELEEDVAKTKEQEANVKKTEKEVAKIPVENENTVLAKVLWVVVLSILLAIIFIIWLSKRRKRR